MDPCSVAGVGIGGQWRQGLAQAEGPRAESRGGASI
jgi:hypothetical protein